MQHVLRDGKTLCGVDDEGVAAETVARRIYWQGLAATSLRVKPCCWAIIMEEIRRTT